MYVFLYIYICFLDTDPNKYPANHLVSPHCRRDAEENQRRKCEKTCELRQKQFKEWRRSVWARKQNKQFIYYFTPGRRWKYSSLIFHSISACITEHNSGQPFPPKFLCCPILFARGGRVGRRESLDVVWTLPSNSQNTGVLSTLFLLQIQNAAPCRLLWNELTLFQADSWWYVYRVKVTEVDKQMPTQYIFTRFSGILPFSILILNNNF